VGAFDQRVAEREDFIDDLFEEVRASLRRESAIFVKRRFSRLQRLIDLVSRGPFKMRFDRFAGSGGERLKRLSADLDRLACDDVFAV
jgi:hypothetical protein